MKLFSLPPKQLAHFACNSPKKYGRRDFAPPGFFCVYCSTAPMSAGPTRRW